MAVTEKITVSPTNNVWLAGCVVIYGGTSSTVSTATELVTEPQSLYTNTV